MLDDNLEVADGAANPQPKRRAKRGLSAPAAGSGPEKKVRKAAKSAAKAKATKGKKTAGGDSPEGDDNEEAEEEEGDEDQDSGIEG